MADEHDPNFTETVNRLEALGYLYQKGLVKRERVEELVRSLMAEMTEEQLHAYAEFQKQREREAAERVHELKKALSEAEAERERRKK